jgi:hypothetical protein
MVDSLGRLNSRFVIFAAVLTLSSVSAVLLVKRVRFEYDSSTQCTLDNSYTEITSTSGNSSSLSYRVNYKFVVGNEAYSGSDTIYQRPMNPLATVYFRAGKPQDNRLFASRWNNNALIAGGIALLIAMIAYWRLPTNYFIGVPTASRQGVGDSGGEHLTLSRGKYNAWFYVEIAFFGQVVLTGVVVASLLSAVPSLQPTSDVVLGVAAPFAVWLTLWVYSDRWHCIEAYSSQFCSGIANFSMFYVPVIALVYANSRAVMRLKGN